MKVSEGRVYRIMKANGLKSKTARKYKPQTTDSKHNLPVAENILNREFSAEKPCQKWVSDIRTSKRKKDFCILPVYSICIIKVLSTDQCKPT